MKRKHKRTIFQVKEVDQKTQYLEVPFEVKQLQDSNDGFFRFEGLASTFGNIDLVDDIVEKGAFIESLQKRDPIILWQHDMFEPIGMPEIAQEQEEGLFVRIMLPKEDTLVSGRVIPQMKVGSIRTMSIGFKVVEFSIDQNGIRRLEKVDLKEISLVTFPANPLATVSDFKTVTPFQENLPVASTSRTWDSSAAIARVREKTNSTESPSASYRRAFLWYDESAPDNFGSYKFPFVDVVDGRLTVIPRAINNAKARLSNSNIPASDKPKVEANIERYQKKFEDKNFDEIELIGAERAKEINTKRDFEKCLRESGVFTKDAACILAKFFRGEHEEDEAKNEDGNNADTNSAEEETAALEALSELTSKFEENEITNSIDSMFLKLGE